MNRVAVVGTTASGKTTLARDLAVLLSAPHVELDALHWGPAWTPCPREVFRAHVANALEGESWVVDGNYGSVRDIVWGRADTLVWLDYRLSVILWRLLWRTLRRVTSGEQLWNENRETWQEAFFGRDNLFAWALRTHRRRRSEYQALLKQPSYAHLRVVRFLTPREMREWFRRLPRDGVR